MTSSPRQTKPVTTVALTRRQIEDILVGQMGWEHSDVTAFWRLAQRHHTDGGRP